MKTIIFDIETGLSLASIFSLKQNSGYINVKNLQSNPYIICGAWKELGKRKIHTVDVAEDAARFAKDPTDDYYVALRLREALEDADLLVGHNIKNFDVKHVNTALLRHGLDPLPTIATADTLKEARANYKFMSNTLDYIGDVTGCGRKDKTEAIWWTEALLGRRGAVKKLVKYTRQDVLLSENVYLKLRPTMKSHPNANMYVDSSDPVCPKCGSTHIQKRGLAVKQTLTYQRFQCRSCGGWSQSKRSVPNNNTEIK